MTELKSKWNAKAVKCRFAGFMVICMCVAALYMMPENILATSGAAGHMLAATSGNGASNTTNSSVTSGNGATNTTNSSATSGNGTSTVSGKIASVTLSKTSYTYDGKAKTPKVTVKDSSGNVIAASNYTVKYSDNKKVGTATVKVTAKGKQYTGSKSVTFKINPPKTSVTKIVANAKGFTVTWNKKTTQTTGYQIRYSTTNKFTASKTESIKLSKNTTVSKKVTGLSGGKKYYVQVRTYKTVSGKTYYSGWSDSVIVTTKR